MLPQAKDQVLDVWGELACFTRPEMKAERFSYPVITPSAARGIYDAIYCKPTEFRWQITRIEILKEPRYIALRRNEVKERGPTEKKIEAWASGREEPEPIWADGDRDLTGSDEKGRTQRQTMALKNVQYRFHAQIRPWPGFEDRLQAMEAQFRRRAGSGKCIYQPYLGCREFPAYFELVEPDAPPAEPVAMDMDNLGWMLYDVFDLSQPGGNEEEPCISVFHPVVDQGVLDIPAYDSDDVRKGVRRER